MTGRTKDYEEACDIDPSAWIDKVREIKLFKSLCKQYRIEHQGKNIKAMVMGDCAWEAVSLEHGGNFISKQRKKIPSVTPSVWLKNILLKC